MLLNNLSNLTKKFPIVQRVACMPLRASVLLFAPLVWCLVLIEAAWDFYMLGEWSSKLSTFSQILSGIQAVFLTIIAILILGGFIGLLRKNEKITRWFAKGALFKLIILGIVGVIHIISVLANEDDLYNGCIDDGDSEQKCKRIKYLNIGLAVGLWVPQEISLFLIALALNSYIHFTYQDQPDLSLHTESGSTNFRDLEAVVPPYSKNQLNPLRQQREMGYYSQSRYPQSEVQEIN